MVKLSSLLANASPETIVHLGYRCGGKLGATAVQDVQAASDWKKHPQDFVGNFVSLKVNKDGEEVLTLFVHNRGETGKYRSFNATRGTVLSLSIG
jgi:hypothetical protein